MIFFISGTSKGIGKQLAEYYLDLGHDVIGCSRSEDSIKNPNYTHFQVDLTDESSINFLTKSIKKKYKIIDVLINNAGGASMNHFLLTPSQTARKLIDLNYLSVFTLSREISRLLKKSPNGRIINFTSVASPLFLQGEAAYASSKSAVETLTRIMAKELADFNITVNAIGPSPIPTDLIKGVPPEKLNSLLDSQAIKRMGTVSDIKNVLDFFIAPESSFITGQIIYLGGVF